MNVGGLPTGTVSSGRDGDRSPIGDRDRDGDADPATRIAELERENEALRTAVETQRRENERIVERYERLLEQERNREASATDARSEIEYDVATATATDTDTDTGTVARIARFLGL